MNQIVETQNHSTMNKVLPLIALFAIVTTSCACGNGRQASLGETAPQTTPDSLDRLLASQGDTLMLSSQELTSFDRMLEAFGQKEEEDFLHEMTKPKDAFFFPEKDIKDNDLMRKVRLRYNHVAVMNRVLHSYEGFKRLATDVDFDEDSHYTLRDTLAWVKDLQPGLSESFVREQVSDTYAQEAALGMLSAFRDFDGNDGEGSPFYLAFGRMNEVFEELPIIVTEEELDAFEETFWDWYDKEKVVPGISRIIRMNMRGYDGEKLSEEELGNLRLAVKREKDIDRRTILALEYVKFRRLDGCILLGDILESGTYTRYLLEAWISWRAHSQMEHSPSSFSVIPNNYFDRLRVKCLNTMLRHCQEKDDPGTRALIDNLIMCEIVHRMGSIAGNSSFLTQMHLDYDEFISPDLLPDEN